MPCQQQNIHRKDIEILINENINYLLLSLRKKTKF